MAVSQFTQKLSQEEIKVDMTPMIDVTFLLLIFFMCTLHFKSLEGMLASYLPKDQGVFSVPVKSNPQEPIHIKLLRSNENTTILWVGASKFQKEDKFDRLYNLVKAIVSKSVIQKKAGIPIIIDPEINVTFQDVISTLNVCRKVQALTDKPLDIKFSAKAIEEK